MSQHGGVGPPRLGRRSEEDAQRTRTEILRAALELFAARGYDGVSVRDIALSASTTHSLIRHHFGSKSAVWCAVVDAADDAYISAMRPILTQSTDEEDPNTALTLVLRGLLRTAARHPEITRLLLHEGTRGGERLDYILVRVEPLRHAASTLLARLHQHGLLREFDEDTFYLILLTAGQTPLALSALSAHVLGRDVLTAEYADEHAATIAMMLSGRRQGR